MWKRQNKQKEAEIGHSKQFLLEIPVNVDRYAWANAAKWQN